MTAALSDKIEGWISETLKPNKPECEQGVRRMIAISVDLGAKVSLAGNSLRIDFPPTKEKWGEFHISKAIFISICDYDVSAAAISIREKVRNGFIAANFIISRKPPKGKHGTYKVPDGDDDQKWQAYKQICTDFLVPNG